MADDVVRGVLQSWGFPGLIDTFRDNYIGGDSFGLLDAETIKELIPQIGIRLRFTESYKTYQKRNKDNTSGNDKSTNDDHTDGKDQAAADSDSVSLTCFKCYKSVNGLQALFQHHRYIHNIHSNSSTNIICPVCHLSYGLYKTYKRHVLLHHQRAQVENGEAADAFVYEPDFDAADYDVQEGVNSEGNISDNDSDEGDNGEKFDDVKYCLVAFISSMKKKGVPTSSIEFMTRNMEDLMTKGVCHAQKTICTLHEKYNNGSLDDYSFEEAFQGCTVISKPFDELNSEYKQIQYLMRNGYLVLPVEQILGYIYKPQLTKTGRMQQVRQQESFQCVPFKKLCQTYLQQPGMMKAILSHEKEGSESVLESYRDGEFFKKEFAEENENIFPVVLYCDDFEPANPLGSRRGQHKLCAFYIQFLNIPRKLQSSLDNILLAALAKSKLVSKYGIDSILKVLVNDLQEMYTDGIHVNSPGEYQGLVKPKLFQICGDNLGLHLVMGFSCGFTANYPCRRCKAPRGTCQEQEEEQRNLLRNRENFEEDIETNNLAETGVSRNGILNELPYYHVTDNYVLDIMHDFLEGMVPLEVKLVIQYLIDDGKFTLEELNSRITAFSYGFVDKQNRPCQITAATLAKPKSSSRQTASQMQCLFLYLPLLIGDKVDRDEESDVWELLLILLDIYKLVVAPSISIEATFMLKAKIGDHHSLASTHSKAAPFTALS
ncbi:uncharacterized protein LOC117288084 [Asterias rubens]|uniref:uncharacterized protein LOC117288084 n=1 Tax=Asterias rubens TaxID=7604 RepID=UPI001455434E|nr:uncharacterized protein LOC117288084 [Asterias rubens]